MGVDFGTYHHSTPTESNDLRKRAEKAFSELLRSHGTVFDALKSGGAFVIGDLFPRGEADTELLPSALNADR